MPVPGPRNQFRPAPGYRNPGNEDGNAFNLWHRPGPVADPGRTPGTMHVALRGNILAAGTIRKLWRQSVNVLAAQAPYSWTSSRPMPGDPEYASPRPYFVTTALRYMTRSVYAAGGTDNTRLSALHSAVHPRVASKPVSLQAGSVRNRPTVRNRLTSFGSRVPPINSKVPAAQ